MNSLRTVLAAATLATGLLAVAGEKAEAKEMAIATIIDPTGAHIGQAVFEQAPAGVIVQVRVAGLPPGPKGIHLHSVGACSPDFTAAKGHINPEGNRHGLRNAMPDNGDLPNLHVAADGTAAAEFFPQRIRVSAPALGGAAPLLDEDGSAIVIHAAPDDHRTQPIGGAGGRIGCGVIRAGGA